MIKFNNKFKTEYGTGVYLISIAAILICQLICFIIFSAAPDGDTGEIIKTSLNLIFQASNITVFLVFIFTKKTKPDIFLNTFKSQKSNDAQKSKKIIVFCATGFLFGLVSLFFFAAAAQSGSNLLVKIGYATEPEYEAGIVSRDVILLIITIVAAPVCEELIFRSALASGLKKKFNDYVTAVLVGLAFALMHMNPEQTIYQFFLGFGATLLALSSGSVIPSIIMHATSNLIVALDMVKTPGFTHFFDWYEKSFTSSNLALGLSAPLLAITGLLIFIYGAKFLKKYALQKQYDDEAQIIEKTAAEDDAEIEKLKTRGIGETEGFFAKNRAMIIYVLGIAICLFMWVSVFIDRI